MRRHANPPLRATVGRGSSALAKAQVLDVERMGYWIAFEEFVPGQARWTQLVGSQGFEEWSEVDDSAKETSATVVARGGSALGGSAKTKQKRDGPRKPERRRMAVPPAPSVSPAHTACSSTCSKMETGDDGPKQKKMRSSIVSEERDKVTSRRDGSSLSSSVSSKAGDSIASLGELQDSTPPPKSAPPVTPRTQSGGATAAAGCKGKKKISPPEKSPTRSLGGAASGSERESLPGEAQGLPKSSDAWLLPISEHIPLSHPSSVQHKRPPKEFKLKIPDYQRLLTIPNETPGEPPHVLVLSVAASTIPNGGRGLYCTYRGPSAYWKVSDYVDLGCYGPHTANDIKPDYIMEIKNFREFCFLLLEPTNWLD